MWGGCTISTCSSQASMCWSRGNSPSSTRSSLLWWPWSFTPPMCLYPFTCGWRWSSSLSWSEGNRRAQWPSWTNHEGKTFLSILCVTIGLKPLVYFLLRNKQARRNEVLSKAMSKSSTFAWIPAPSWDFVCKDLDGFTREVLHDITHHMWTLLCDWRPGE